MKNPVRLLVAGFVLCHGVCLAAEKLPPKKLLVVSTSTRNHFTAAIEVAEKALVQMAAQTQAFTIDFVHQPEAPQPKKPKPPEPLKPDASAEEKAAFAKLDAEYRAADAEYTVAEKKFMDEMKAALQKLSAESLKNYDAVVFCYTSGDLPLPDNDAFISWIKAGHGFIGLGNAMETMNTYPPYYDMLGGRWVHFKGTQGWKDVELFRGDASYPVNKDLPILWTIQEFSYKLPDFTLSDTAHTHEMYFVEKSPTDGTSGYFPMAWCRDYGQGRVFFTALGGNQDLWDPDRMPRKNAPEIARIFLMHLRAGVFWALGIEPHASSAP